MRDIRQGGYTALNDFRKRIVSQSRIFPKFQRTVFFDKKEISMGKAFYYKYLDKA
jgi:hypothetical protein